MARQPPAARRPRISTLERGSALSFSNFGSINDKNFFLFVALFFVFEWHNFAEEKEKKEGEFQMALSYTRKKPCKNTHTNIATLTGIKF